MSPAELRAALTKWRVPFVEEDGWETRGRPASTGDFGDMHGIVNHHTATPADATATVTNRLLRVGRTDLPGPLCHFGTQRNGKVALIAHGRANHAGAVRPEVLADFLADRHVTRPSTTAGETVDGNAFLYGNEVHNNGTTEPFNDDQLLSIVLLNAAICDFHGWSHFAASQHKNITARKTDMRNIKGQDSDDWLLPQVKLALQLGPGRYVLPWNRTAPVPPPAPDPIPAPEDDMAFTDAQMVDFVRRGVQAELGDENVGAFSDRIVAKVLERLPATPPSTSTPAPVEIDYDRLATAVADKLAARLQS